MKCLKLAFAASLVALSANSAWAVTVYTNRAAWEAAVGAAITTDTFSNAIAGAASINFDSGVTSTATGSYSFDYNSVSAGRYNGAVDNDLTAGFTQIQWTFPTPISGFGADWFSTAEGAGILQIIGNFDGSGEVGLTPGTLLGGDGTGFVGVIGLAPFTSIRFNIANPATMNNEMFTIDNLSFAAVPEPGTLALLGLGLAGLAPTRRRKQ